MRGSTSHTPAGLHSMQVEAYKANIIMPNKQMESYDQFYEGHLLESETYVGGHVEAIESGVFRSDLPTKFRCDPSGYHEVRIPHPTSRGSPDANRGTVALDKAWRAVAH